MDRVRTHIGNEADRSPFFKGNAFIKLLGQHHGLFRCKIKPLDRFLLKGTGRKRSYGAADPVLYCRRSNGIGLVQQFLGHGPGFLFVMDDKFFALFFRHLCRKFMTWFICRKGYGTRPIFLRLKGINFLLPVADDLDCYRLDTACRKTFGNLAPQKGRQLIADNTIEDATRLLCVDLIHINGSRMLDSFFDRMRCDFMKGNPAVAFWIDAQ